MAIAPWELNTKKPDVSAYPNDQLLMLLVMNKTSRQVVRHLPITYFEELTPDKNRVLASTIDSLDITNKEQIIFGEGDAFNFDDDQLHAGLWLSNDNPPSLSAEPQSAFSYANGWLKPETALNAEVVGNKGYYYLLAELTADLRELHGRLLEQLGALDLDTDEVPRYEVADKYGRYLIGGLALHIKAWEKSADWSDDLAMTQGIIKTVRTFTNNPNWLAVFASGCDIDEWRASFIGTDNNGKRLFYIYEPDTEPTNQLLRFNFDTIAEIDTKLQAAFDDCLAARVASESREIEL